MQPPLHSTVCMAGKEGASPRKGIPVRFSRISRKEFFTEPEFSAAGCSPSKRPGILGGAGVCGQGHHCAEPDPPPREPLLSSALTSPRGQMRLARGPGSPRVCAVHGNTASWRSPQPCAVRPGPVPSGELPLPSDVNLSPAGSPALPPLRLGSQSRPRPRPRSQGVVGAAHLC